MRNVHFYIYIYIYIYLCDCVRHRVQELCESRGGHPGLPVLLSLSVSVDVKQYWTTLMHWSRLVPNMSSDIRGHKALHHHSVRHVQLLIGWCDWCWYCFSVSASCRGQGAGVLAEPENDAYLHCPVERVCHAADASVSNRPTQKV